MATISDAKDFGVAGSLQWARRYQACGRGAYGGWIEDAASGGWIEEAGLVMDLAGARKACNRCGRGE